VTRSVKSLANQFYVERLTVLKIIDKEDCWLFIVEFLTEKLKASKNVKKNMIR
jgi:hypothetical protein